MHSNISSSRYSFATAIALLCTALIAVLVLAAPLSARMPALQGATSFSGAINTCDPTFQRAFNTSTLSIVGSSVFYETQQFTVSTSGTYTLEMTSSTISDGHASLYNGPFNPASPLTNVMAVDDDGGPDVNPGFVNISLIQGVTYTLVTTTLNNGMTGTYTWSLSGAGSFTLGDNSITLVCPTLTPTLTLTPSPTFTPSVTPSPPVSFSGAINTCDPTFNRPFNTTTLSIVGSSVFYETQQFTISVSGSYTLEMTSSSIADGHASLYDGPFNPASPLTNIQAVDDDGGPGVNPGFVNISLIQGITYTLVTTTLNNGMTGAYAWTLSGAGGVALGSSSVTLDCTSPTTTLTPSATSPATLTLTPSNTIEPSLTPSLTPSETLDPSITPTLTLTPSNTIEPSQTPTETLDPSITPTATLTPSNTPDPSTTATATLTPTETGTLDPVTEVVPSQTPAAPVQAPSEPCRFPLPLGASQGRVLVTVLAYYDPNPGATTDIIVPGDTTWYVIDSAPGYYRIWIDCLGTPLWIPSFLMALG